MIDWPKVVRDLEVENARLRKALADPAQEPVAWQWLRSGHFRKKIPKTAYPEDWRPLYITPPQKQWVGLTDDEIDECFKQMGRGLDKYATFARAIEAKLRGKNK